MFDVNEMMKNAWKMMYVFPPIPIFICQQLFFVSLLIYFLKSNQHQLHQLLSIITNYFYYIYRCQSNQKTRKKFFENQKKTTVAWNCLCFTLIYYQSSFMLLRTTIYWQIGIKKIEISFQHKNCLVYLIVYIHHSDGW